MRRPRHGLAPRAPYRVSDRPADRRRNRRHGCAEIPISRMKPTNISDPAIRKRLIVSAGGLVAPGLLALYALFDPGTSILAPKCPFKLLTGFDCPACGSQRTLHALLRGQWLAAFRYNPFLLLSVPYLLLVAYTTWSGGGRAARWKGRVQHPKVVLTYLALLVGWWIVRNTPLWQ